MILDQLLNYIIRFHILKQLYAWKQHSKLEMGTWSLKFLDFFFCFE